MTNPLASSSQPYSPLLSSELSLPTEGDFPTVDDLFPLPPLSETTMPELLSNEPIAVSDEEFLLQLAKDGCYMTKDDLAYARNEEK